MEKERRLGLSLSGGGYRATVYHLGTLRKLNELGLLEQVKVISTVSGGSITGAYYGLHGGNFANFERMLRKAVQGNIIRGVLRSPQFLLLAAGIVVALSAIVSSLLTDYAWIGFVGLIALMATLALFQFQLFPVSRIIEGLYNRYFFEGKTLADLRPEPALAINATNLETGRPFVFSKTRMGDSSYAYRNDAGQPQKVFAQERFPIARSVAASACVPFAFSPIAIDKQFYVDPAKAKEFHPALVDGGVYDNQGLHNLANPESSGFCHYVVVSDAGNRLPFENYYPNTFSLLIRTCDVFMRRIKNMQMIQQIYAPTVSQTNITAYQSLGFDVRKSVDGFVDALVDGTVQEEIWRAHGITQDMIDAETAARAQTADPQLEGALTAYLRKRIGEADILARACTRAELETARGVGTNLVTLKQEQVDCLIKHAEAITEIQVRLYLPMLLDQ